MHAGTSPSPSTLLLVGASRGLGLAMAAEFVERGWHVVGTVRGTARTGLHDLAREHPGQVGIESLDVTRADEVAALRERLAGRRFRMLFVNAGIADGARDEALGDASNEAFARVLLTNVLGPMRAIERLQDLVDDDGTLGVMSSGQGSLGNNEKGGHEVYRSSKAALNMALRSFAARQRGGSRALVLMAPGWIRTALGGPDAPTGADEAMPQVVDVLLAQQGRPGLRYLDRDGNTVPW